VNSTAILPSTFEAQVFGYMPGSWTGANPKGEPGLVRSAQGGTVFFDEIGDLPIEHQPKLLRLLEDRKVMPVGGREEDVDVLVVCATNRDLDDAAEKGAFRRDFYKRFRVAISLPSLDERVEDLPSIAAAVAEKNHQSLAPTSAEGRAHALDYCLSPARVDVQAMERLMLRDYTGNVRELEGIVWRAVARSLENEPAPALRQWALDIDPEMKVARRAPAVLTKAAVEEALEAHGGNATHAAQSLGVSRGAFNRARGKLLK
jgi:transcriptional regulator with PAS, ATPase and Fis domain